MVPSLFSVLSEGDIHTRQDVVICLPAESAQPR